MKRDWVKECVTGERPKPVVESKVSNGVRAILGERANAERPPEPDKNTTPPPVPTSAPRATTPAASPPATATPEPEAEGDQPLHSEGDVAGLVSAWASGSHMAVAQHVLAGLNSYRDFVSLIYQVGQEGALELASLMDELSSGSPDEDEGASLPPSRQPEGELDSEPVASPDEAPIR